MGSICRDGALAIIGAKARFVRLAKNVIHILFLLTVPFIGICWQAKSFSQYHTLVMEETILSVNFLRFRALNHRLFKILCEGMRLDHTVLIFYTNVKWLSKDLVLPWVYKLQAELKIFL